MRFLRTLLPALVLAALVGASPAQAIVGGAQASITDYPYQARVLMARPERRLLLRRRRSATPRTSSPPRTACTSTTPFWRRPTWPSDTAPRPHRPEPRPGSPRSRCPRAYLTDAATTSRVLTLAVAADLRRRPSKPIPLATAADLGGGGRRRGDAFATGWGATTEGGNGPDLHAGGHAAAARRLHLRAHFRYLADYVGAPERLRRRQGRWAQRPRHLPGRQRRPAGAGQRRRLRARRAHQLRLGLRPSLTPAASTPSPPTPRSRLSSRAPLRRPAPLRGSAGVAARRGTGALPP